MSSVQNGSNSANGNDNGNGTDNPRLEVLIVGAGLCGLAAACGLREFANVTILETTPELREVGAAVNLTPNAHRILKAYGCDLVRNGAVECFNYKEWWTEGDFVKKEWAFDPLKYGCEWVLCHRADLQAELYDLATREDGPGEPCRVLFNQRVATCDPETATVTTTTGHQYSADVLIGADGIKSAIRSAVVGEASPSPSGHSAYRGLLRAEAIAADPDLAALGLLDHQFTLVHGPDRIIITYPTRNGDVLNLAAILPDSELHELSEDRWSAPGDPRKLVQSYSTFPEKWTRLLSKTEKCGLWQLRDQDALEHWVAGPTIIVGDAAHSMLPQSGQGASMAIEDGEAVAAFLHNVPRDSQSVHAALERVFNVRYKRATYVQELGRRNAHALHHTSSAKGIPETENMSMPDVAFDPMQYLMWVWDYHGAERWERERPEWLVRAKT